MKGKAGRKSKSFQNFHNFPDKETVVLWSNIQITVYLNFVLFKS